MIWWRFFWVFLIASIVFIIIILAITIPLGFCSLRLFGRLDIGIIIGILIGLIPAVFWVKKCFRFVGTKDISAQAVVTLFGGMAVRVVGPGLCWIWWPFQNLRIFPTHNYQLDFSASEVHSKEDKNYRTAVMKVDTAIYIMWPRWNRIYDFPNGEKRQGSDILLRNTFFALPVDTEDAQEVKEFFEQAVLDAVRRAMVRRNHKECRDEKEQIENEIKRYLLEEEGNPFRECGIPSVNLDVAITSIKFTDEMEKAFSAPEVGAREAKGEKAFLQETISVLISKGVSPGLAGMIARKGAKEGMSASELRDFVVIAKLLGVNIEQLIGKL